MITSFSKYEEKKVFFSGGGGGGGGGLRGDVSILRDAVGTADGAVEFHRVMMMILFPCCCFFSVVSIRFKRSCVSLSADRPHFERAALFCSRLYFLR